MGKLPTIENWDSKAYDVGSYMQNYCANQILSDQTFENNLRILDLGCGDGKNTANIINYALSATILGIDRSPEMIESAREKYSSDAISFEQQDIIYLNVKGQFDMVVSFFCLDWIKDQETLQRKIYQALKPQGQALLVISTGKDEVAQIVERVASSDKWISLLKNYNIPAGLHDAEDYRRYMLQAGFFIDDFDVIKIPVELPNIDLFYQFITALPLFGNVLTKKQNDEISRDITDVFLAHCNKKYKEKLICLGEMIVIKAHK